MTLPPEAVALPPVATIAQVAAYLQVSQRTIVRMIEDGRLEARRLHVGRGGRYRIRREAVLALLDGDREA